MESILSAVFEIESEAYQAMTILRRNPANEDFVISQAALVKKSGGQISVEDAFNTAAGPAADFTIGGVVGGVIGILGGPLGMLMAGSLGAVTGALTGIAADAGETAEHISMMEKVSEQYAEGQTGVILLAQETDTAALDALLSRFRTSVVREEAAVVAGEVRRAAALQEELQKAAKKRLRETKKALREEHVRGGVEFGEQIREEFEKLKKKLLRKG